MPILLRLSILMLCVTSFKANAEFICTSDLNYQWKKEKEDQKVFLDRLEQSEATEELSKRKLELLLVKAKVRASEECKRTHQDLTGCITSKLEAKVNIFGSLSFTARKILEDAIASDCQRQQGTCGEVTTSEIQCKEVKPASSEGAATSEPSKKEGEKEGKKKK